MRSRGCGDAVWETEGADSGRRIEVCGDTGESYASAYEKREDVAGWDRQKGGHCEWLLFCMRRMNRAGLNDGKWR
jgi:hypothetical protein